MNRRRSALLLAPLVFFAASCGDKPAAPEPKSDAADRPASSGPAQATAVARAHGAFRLSYAVYTSSPPAEVEAVAESLKKEFEAAGWQVRRKVTTKTKHPLPDEEYARSLLGDAKMSALANKAAVIVVDAEAKADRYAPLFPGAAKAVADASARLDGDVWDDVSWSLLAAEDFKRQQEYWDAQWPFARDHITIQVARQKHGARLITVGLAKFGFPELVVERASPANEKQIGGLLNLAAQTLVERMDVPARQLELSIEDIKNKHAREYFSSDLRQGATGAVSLPLGEIPAGPYDPDSEMLRLFFPGDPAVESSVREQAAIGRLFGASPDPVASVDPGSDAWLAASKLARADLMARKSTLQKGLRAQQTLHIKAAFPTPDGGNEWMWVDVLEWKGKTLHGRLDNEPTLIPTLKLGQKVQVRETEIADFVLVDASTGEEQGNYFRPAHD